MTTTNRFLGLLLAMPALTQARLCPFDLPQFQSVLSECRLQCPETSNAVVKNGNFQNFTIPRMFYVPNDNNSSMVVSMAKKNGDRCELRHNPQWSTTEGPQRFKASLRIEPGDDKGFTFMQIHSKTFRGTDGVDYRKGPILMMGRNYNDNTSDHLWASVRVSLKPKKGRRFDLGPRPEGFFDLEVVVENCFLKIWVNGALKMELDVHHIAVLPHNYFKTGVYLHKGTGPHKITYKQLEMGPFKTEQSDASSSKSQRTPSDPNPERNPAPPTQTEQPAYGTDVRVDKLVLVDATTNEDLSDLVDGQVLDLTYLPEFSVRASVEGRDKVSRVAFRVDEKEIRRDHSPPFALTRDSPQRGYDPWSPNLGRHVITATAYGQRGRFGFQGGSLTTEIEVIRSEANDLSLDHATMNPTEEPEESTAEQPSVVPTSLPRVVRLVLVDGESGQDLFSLHNGDVVDTTLLPRFSIRAETNPIQVGSVRFVVNDDNVIMENFAPYAIAGDQQNKVLPWMVDPGEYNITATPYSKSKGEGIEGINKSVVIQVI